MPLITRRRLLVGGAAAVAGLIGLRFVLPRLLRPEAAGEVRGAAADLARVCFDGLDRSAMWDVHVHVVGLGSGGTGCWINPELQSHLHPVKKFQFDVYRAVLGMEDEATADADYIDRLFALHRLTNPDGTLLLTAFDQFVDESGAEVPEASSFFTPDRYVFDLCERLPDALPIASIHPYRRDALTRLDRAAERGARAVKWLPNAMGIDPASPLCRPFYRRLADLDLPLLTHGGTELAVDGGAHQELGNPLRLRAALDEGVRVIVAHCASFGRARDLDAPGEREADAFDLFMRLFTDPRYEGRLFADISAITALNRSGRPLRELLMAPELHPRLVNGSDYPLPCIGPLFSTRKLQFDGYLDSTERKLCDRIHDVNPLLFDFVVKRCLKVEENGRTYRFADSVFETSWLFGERPRTSFA